MRRHQVAMWMACALALGGCGKSKDNTQLVVTVWSDFSVPNEMDEVRIHVVGQERSIDHPFQLSATKDAGTFTIPIQLGLVPAGAKDVSIAITAIGSLKRKDMVWQRATVQFIRDQAHEIVLYLAKACKYVQCDEKAGYTCENGTCNRKIQINTSELPTYTPGQAPTPAKPSVTGAADGAVPDGVARPEVGVPDSFSRDGARLDSAPEAAGVAPYLDAAEWPDTPVNPPDSDPGPTDSHVVSDQRVDAPEAASIPLDANRQDTTQARPDAAVDTPVVTPDLALPRLDTASAGDAPPASPARLEASAPALDFGNISVGGNSPTREVTITNTGGTATRTLSLVRTGESAAFPISSNTCNTVLPPGASCSFVSGFSPASPGFQSATATVTDDTVVVAIGLSGTGLTGAALTTGGVSSLAFGPVVIGSSSAVQTITITNTGQVPSGTLQLAASPNGIFAIQSGVSGDCLDAQTQLQAGASCTVRMVFTPTAVGSANGTLSFSATPGGNGSVSLTGTGQSQASLGRGAVASLDLGPVVVGAASSAQSFTITNNGQQRSGTISIAADPAAFAIQTGQSGDCGAAQTLDENASCRVRVVFTPQQIGPSSGTISFSATPGGGSSVSVSGTGVCAAGDHDGGSGTCVAVGTCTSGYHNDGTGNCVVNKSCPTDQLSDGTGTCVPMAGVVWTQRGTQQAWRGVASSSDGAKLVAVASNGYIYTSTDYGVTWTQRATSRLWRAVASSSDGTKLVAVVSGGFIYTSADSGLTWTERATSGYWYCVASSADGSRLIAASPNGMGSGGCSISSDFGVTWTPLSCGDRLSLAASSDLRIILGYADVGTLRLSSDFGSTWSSVGPSDRYWGDVDCSADGSTMIANNELGGVQVSTDAGLNWTAPVTGSGTGATACSSDGSKMFATDSAHIYVSVDSGATWTTRASAQNFVHLASSADGTKLVGLVRGTSYIYTSSGPMP